MKTTGSFLLKLLLPLGLMSFVLQGCYTQFVTLRDEDSNYEQEYQSDSTGNGNYYYGDNDNWQYRHTLGFNYYYPGWPSYWSWDYGCAYPTYWDPWYWGSIYNSYYNPYFYPYYGYYPHHWGYGDWNYYGYYSGYGGYHYTVASQPFVTRNSGYIRSGSYRTNNDNIRSGSVRASIQSGSTRTTEGTISIPRSAGRISGQNQTAGSTRTSRGASGGVSTSRQPSSRQYNPSVQQPRYRDQSNAPAEGRSYRGSNGSSRESYRGQGSGDGQSSSSGHYVTPSYTPPPSSSSSSTPSSRGDGGSRSSGGERSGGSGRSR